MYLQTVQIWPPLNDLLQPKHKAPAVPAGASV